MLLRILLDDNDTTLMIYLLGGLISLLIIYFFFRWVFAVDKRVKQNDTIINLLRLLAKKSGANDDEIHRCIKQ